MQVIFFNCTGSPFLILSTPIHIVNLSFDIPRLLMKKQNKKNHHLFKGEKRFPYVFAFLFLFKKNNK